ncbi:crossover junction endodeoxyribonuclease RuvC [Acetobacter fallax]|uniref:Crossover junction endodeoxyribonuclease RuvC n=1 Tax=Acetobacter fallax TaxID=1737473 RepID=A0ABX0KF22_9PROT|nr:crossover junction endodeoxyribonuclease RuvC [Acetobacter fallax]NHO33711.1 crossover junction endodeoxyribonuclease RuvC [Acetobacter fallax]NHO37272.1 crossover junction endodeoxyribonuclease RuvC [Acetobacter fallax]
MTSRTRLLGIDPGLRFTGWGIIDVEGNRLIHVADGVIATDGDKPVPARLCALYDALTALIQTHKPREAAVEETYVNRNGSSTLKLGYARGVALLAPALEGLAVSEYGAMAVKRAVVGTGAATKEQVEMMVRRLLPAATISRTDASDALAVVICHAHLRASALRVAAGRASVESRPAGTRAPRARRPVSAGITPDSVG